jgi:hypothetical protein
MASLVHTPWATHYYHKTGLYSTGGAETSSSAQNVQSVYSFIRGAARQYGTAVFGQVSVFNGGISGYKTYGFGSKPCVPNGHGPACAGVFFLLSFLRSLFWLRFTYVTTLVRIEMPGQVWDESLTHEATALHRDVVRFRLLCIRRGVGIRSSVEKLDWQDHANRAATGGWEALLLIRWDAGSRSARAHRRRTFRFLRWVAPPMVRDPMRIRWFVLTGTSLCNICVCHEMSDEGGPGQ